VEFLARPGNIPGNLDRSTRERISRYLITHPQICPDSAHHWEARHHEPYATVLRWCHLWCRIGCAETIQESLATFSSSGSLPSGIHFCQPWFTSGLQIWVLVGENVAPECLTLCITLCTSNCMFPNKSPNSWVNWGCVSGFPCKIQILTFRNLWWEDHQWIICATLGISSCRINNMHRWNSAGELVNPVGSEVSRSRPSGERECCEVSACRMDFSSIPNPQKRFKILV